MLSILTEVSPECIAGPPVDLFPNKFLSLQATPSGNLNDVIHSWNFSIESYKTSI